MIQPRRRALWDIAPLFSLRVPGDVEDSDVLVRYAAKTACPAGRVLPRREAQPGSKLAPGAEHGRTGYGRGKCGRCDRANTGNRGEESGDRMTAMNLHQPIINLANACSVRRVIGVLIAKQGFNRHCLADLFESNRKAMRCRPCGRSAGGRTPSTVYWLSASRIVSSAARSSIQRWLLLSSSGKVDSFMAANSASGSIYKVCPPWPRAQMVRRWVSSIHH